MTTALLQRRVLLAARPVGVPRLADFRIDTAPVPDPAAGELLVQAHYLSADPLQRWRMDARTDYGNTIGLGDVVWGRMAGQVIRSRNAAWRDGEFVEGMLGWQEYAISDGDTRKARYAPGLTRIDPAHGPISLALGILGMPGVTAYFAMLDICKPRAGDTVVVSAAAGTVGALAGQIAKLHGARVVGIAGGPAKAAHVTATLGFDAAIDYRSGVDIDSALRAACPDGVAAYFDNVGGAVADAVYRHLARGARIALVGRVAQLGGHGTRADSQEHLIAARARVEGFIVYDYEARAGEARDAIAGWLAAGVIRYAETVHDGIESAPQALIDVLTGRGMGKHVIRLR